jgi:hypothetical protein
MGRIIPYIMEKKFETTSQLCSSSGTIKDMSLHDVLALGKYHSDLQFNLSLANSWSAGRDHMLKNAKKNVNIFPIYIYMCYVWLIFFKMVKTTNQLSYASSFLMWGRGSPDTTMPDVRESNGKQWKA